jgi:hypothetical protein
MFDDLLFHSRRRFRSSGGHIFAPFAVDSIMLRTRAYFFFLFAQRAFCASEIRLRPAADSLPRLARLAPTFAPFSNASISCSIFANSVINMWCRFRTAFSNLVTMSTFPPICDWECANSVTARALLREPMKPAASAATLHASLAGWAALWEVTCTWRLYEQSRRGAE